MGSRGYADSEVVWRKLLQELVRTDRLGDGDQVDDPRLDVSLRAEGSCRDHELVAHAELQPLPALGVQERGVRLSEF